MPLPECRPASCSTTTARSTFRVLINAVAPSSTPSCRRSGQPQHFQGSHQCRRAQATVKADALRNAAALSGFPSMPSPKPKKSAFKGKGTPRHFQGSHQCRRAKTTRPRQTALCGRGTFRVPINAVASATGLIGSVSRAGAAAPSGFPSMPSPPQT